jgi:hypothetical protein
MMSGFPFGKRRRRPSWPATATGAALSPALCRVPHPGSDPLDLYANGRFCANASTAAQIGAAFPPRAVDLRSCRERQQWGKSCRSTAVPARKAPDLTSKSEINLINNQKKP